MTVEFSTLTEKQQSSGLSNHNTRTKGVTSISKKATAVPIYQAVVKIVKVLRDGTCRLRVSSRSSSGGMIIETLGN